MTESLSAGGPARTAPAALGLEHADEVARARALLVVRLAIGLYLVEVLLNLARPRIAPNEPSLTIFWQLPGELEQGPLESLGSLFAIPRAAFWLVLAGIAVGIVLQIIAVRRPPEGRQATVLTWATLATLVGSFALFSLVVLAGAPLIALACVPSSAFALWLVYRSQRFAWLPVPMLLTAFGWGALIQFGLGRAFTGLAYGTINGYLNKGMEGGLTARLGDSYRVLDYTLLHLSFVNQLAAAIGIVLLILMFRHRVTDVVTGLVIGAATGLGYNCSESVLFIQLWGILGTFNGATGGFEYWIRQSVALFGGQVAFGALVGAGIGLAAQARRRSQRVRIVVATLVAATGGAVATEVCAAWLSKMARDHVDIGSTLDTLVISPSLWIAPQVPFLVVCVLLLRSGLRVRLGAARTAVKNEAAADGGAITEREAPFLADPALRFWTVVSTWRRHGRPAALALRRLQRAQLELAGWRWQQQRAGADGTPNSEVEGEKLQGKVLELRAVMHRLVAS
ncbi:PrsW family glutamic-type intramembrane protease [Streptomyces flavidovirens]|uniref:PrsW family glutamic-type intramembrane protease n=1 Tax=Streptomyces flavidovirens TaxID=67298 RepID=UPI0004057A54|nr:PrsW family glutamic-type intramembrane protease [Streptomyces flavidovirens]